MTKTNNQRDIPLIAALLGLPAVSQPWAGVDAVLPILERMRGEGAVVLIKLDGQRTAKGDNGPYTIVISGGAMGSDFTRRDAFSLEDALAACIVEYAEHAWGYRRSMDA